MLLQFGAELSAWQNIKSHLEVVVVVVVVVGKDDLLYIFKVGSKNDYFNITSCISHDILDKICAKFYQFDDSLNHQETNTPELLF